MPAYFERYINLVPEDQLSVAFQHSLTAIEHLDVGLMRKIGDKVYAPGKWTIRDIFQHMIDSERIFVYRALRFARKDSTKLHSFEENDYAVAANANSRSLEQILSELEATRVSTMLMFESFDGETLLRKGTSSDKEISVLGLGFTIIGHQIHHLNVIIDRYADL
jgi:hypothetical protein